MAPQVEPIEVLVAARHSLASQLLADACARLLDLRAEPVSAESLVETARATQPRVVILSHKSNDIADGSFQTLRDLLAVSPKTRVVLLVDEENSSVAVDALRFGARGVFCFSQPLEMLIRCIKQVDAGQAWVSAGQLELLLAVLAGAPVNAVLDANGGKLLSRREQDVIHWIGEGLSNREIAKALRISENTVKNYVYRIFDKLGVSNRVEAAMYAATQRLSAPAKPPQTVSRSSVPTVGAAASDD